MESFVKDPMQKRTFEGARKNAASVDSEELPPRPVIFGYLDYRHWLRDRLKYNQMVNPRHSQRWLAKRAGFKAPQLLSMIIQSQRNLTGDKVDSLIDALKLDEQESAYFRALVDLAAADSHVRQQAILEQIKVGFQNGLFAPISDEGVEIFREWYFPAVRELVCVQGFKDDPAWIAERINITVDQASEALATLIRHGFLRREGKALVRAEPSVRTVKTKHYPIFLANYHMMMFERAFQAVRLPREKRHIEGLTIALAPESLRQLREMIQKFFREVDFMVESQSNRQEVFHLELGLFALSNQGNSTIPASKTE